MDDRYHQIESSAQGGVRSNQFWKTDRKAVPDDWRRHGSEGWPDYRGGSADNVRKKRLPGGVARLVGEKTMTQNTRSRAAPEVAFAVINFDQIGISRVERAVSTATKRNTIIADSMIRTEATFGT